MLHDQKNLPSRQAASSTREPRSGRSSLDIYLDDAGDYGLLAAEEEKSFAYRLEGLRRGLWESLLSLPSLVPAIAALLHRRYAQDEALHHALKGLTSGLRAYRRAPSHETADGLNKHVVAVATLCGELDREGELAQALIDDLERLACGRSPHVLQGADAPSKAALSRYRHRVLRSQATLRRARGRFVCANLRLVVRLAQRYSRNRLSFPDLVQEGNLGLMKAVDRFDPRRGCRFSTYAAWWIRHSITRALVNRGRTVRIPAHLHTVFTKMRHAEPKLAAELGRVPTVDEIARAIDVPSDKVKVARRAMELRAVALETPISDQDTRPAVEVVSQVDVEGWDRGLDDRRHLALVQTAMRALEPMEQDILRHRYGLGGAPRMTLQRLGKRYQLSRERIRQLQQRALTKLREHLDGSPLSVSAFA